MEGPHKKRNILIVVLVVSVGVHLVAIAVMGIIRFVNEVITPPPEFEAVTAVEEPPPPPQPTRPTRQSMPRPTPIAAQSPLDMTVPRIEIDSTPMVMGVSARGGSGGLGLGGSMQASIGVFGGFDPFEGAMKGTFYDTKQDSRGGALKPNRPYYHDLIRRFVTGSWNTSMLRRHFSPETNLYARQIFFPLMRASAGPQHFGVGDVVDEQLWLVHYEGTFKPNRTTRFRFVGRAGEVLIVRLDGRVVFDGSHSLLAARVPDNLTKVSNWNPRTHVDEYFTFGPSFNSGSRHWTRSTETLVFGEWIDVVGDRSYDLEILIGERGGGYFYCFLMYEEEDKPGEALPNGMYRLPIFTTDLGPAQKVNFREGAQGPAVRWD